MEAYSALNRSIIAGLGIVADWTLALSANGDLSSVLDTLVRQSRAHAGMIVRISLPKGDVRYVARSEPQAGKFLQIRARSHADLILGEHLFSAQRGSVWMRSDADQSRSRDDHAPGVQSQVGEAIVIVLERTDVHVDALELQFGTMPDPVARDLLTSMAGTLSKSWGARTPGTVAKRLVRRRFYTVTDPALSPDIPILNPENPAHLSRSEFRVCSLLKEGMTVGVIARTLSVCETTVRSHLSSVFAKTGTSNQVELLHRLNTGSATSERPLERRLA